MSSYLDRPVIDAIAERIFLAMDQKDADGSMHHGFMIGFHEGVSFMLAMERKKALSEAHEAMVRARQECENVPDQTDEEHDTGKRIRPFRPLEPANVPVDSCSGGAHGVI